MDTVETAGGWQEDAACRGVDTDIFYPEDEDGPAGEAAKSYCAVCPVVEECYEFATRPGSRETLGIWGGLTSKERRTKLRRERDRRRRAARLAIDSAV